MLFSRGVNVMAFIPPKYRCDSCGVEEEARWDRNPFYWDLPIDWYARYYRGSGNVYYYCPRCKHKHIVGK